MLNKKFELFVQKVKALRGDPHYVALGMAFGVFVAITPTIPFHTIIVIGMAILFKASKPAAIAGVWISNPFTVVFLYVACYQVGHFFFEAPAGGLESIKLLIEHLNGNDELSHKIIYFSGFMRTQLRTVMIMNAGGIILGLPSGVVTYFLTKQFFIRRQKRKEIRYTRKIT
ncbi:MAG: DUF2062 domain-containing protein [Desulfobacula sp.]|nr:DUF2062 domain-containing protein [Desulfobacula sp.]